MARAPLIVAIGLIAVSLVWFVASRDSVDAAAARSTPSIAVSAASNESVRHSGAALVAPPIARELEPMATPTSRRHGPTRAPVEAVERSPLRVRVVDSQGHSPEFWLVEVRAAPSARSAREEIPVWLVGRGESRAVIRGSGATPMEIAEELRRDRAPLALKALALPTRAAGMMVSDEYTVEPDATDVITLVVVSPTRLTVEIEGPRPSGDLRLEVTPARASNDPVHSRLVVPRSMRGTSTFEVAHSIAYRVCVRGPSAADFAEAIVPAIAPGNTGRVVLHFPRGFQDPLPEDYAELALAGRMIGDDREWPGMWAAVDGGLPVQVDVMLDGSFELWHPRAREVELHATSGEFEARCDPEVATHPFGSRDVRVRVRRGAPEVRLILKFVDADSGAPIQGAVARLSRRDGDRVRSRTPTVGADDVITCTVPVLRDLHVFACARGRRDEIEYLFDSRPLAEGEVYERTVRLTRGFAREFRVVHCSAQTPITGAEVAWNGRILGRSDPDGRVRIELDEWPDELTVTAADHDAATWPTRFEDPLASCTIALCPAD